MSPTIDGAVLTGDIARLFGGIIGSADHPVAAEYLRLIGGERIVETPVIQARLVGSPDRRDERGVSWSWATPGPAGSWRQISEERGGCGLVRDEDGWVLFTDAVGMNPILVRPLDDVVLFGDSVEALAAVGPALVPDWQAWAETIAIGAPLGERTHFSGIRRLGPARALRIGDDGSVGAIGYLPAWTTYTRSPVRPEAMAEALEDALPDEDGEPPAIPLSGGWDSRILAALALRRYRRFPEAWTVGQDDGRDRDLDLSPAVAGALGLTQHVVTQPLSGWPEMAGEARRRMEFATWLHTWFIPLVREMRGAVPAFLDGLAGDVIVKGLFVDEELLEAPAGDHLPLLFARLGGDPERFDRLFRDEVAPVLLEAAREDFLAAAGVFEGHVNQLALAVLQTRTARAIAPAALRLFGPEVRPWFPYLHPEFLRMALTIDPRDKLEGGLSRAILETVGPGVADLPSTNDPGGYPPRTRFRLQAGREAVSWMIGLIEASEPAAALFHPGVLPELGEKGLDQKMAGLEALRALQAASLLADWEIQHRSRLAPTAPPWA